MLGEQKQGKVCVDDDCRDKINSPFATWLQTQFMSRADMDSRIVQLGAKLNQQIKTHARAAAMDAVAAAGAAQAAAGRSSNMLGIDDGLPTKDVSQINILYVVTHELCVGETVPNIIYYEIICACDNTPNILLSVMIATQIILYIFTLFTVRL